MATSLEGCREPRRDTRVELEGTNGQTPSASLRCLLNCRKWSLAVLRGGERTDAPLGMERVETAHRAAQNCGLAGGAGWLAWEAVGGPLGGVTMWLCA